MSTRTTSFSNRRAVLLASILVATSVAAGTGCSTGPAATSPSPAAIVAIQPIEVRERFCPVTGDAVTECSEIAYFESFPVYCKDRASARQLASLEPKQRARLAAEQVLPQKGIANATCPLSGEALTATAAPVVWEGSVVGFATPADANQFRSLPEAKRAKLIEQWRADGGA